MAAILRLANHSQTITTDFISGRLVFEPGSWTSRTAPPQSAYRHEPYGAQPAFSHYQPVVESFDVVGADTAANLIAAINDLQDLLAQARRWHTNTLRSESVWLEWSADGENAKRALVYEGSVQFMNTYGLAPTLPRNAPATAPARVHLRLWITRHPLWERVTTLNTGPTNLSIWTTHYTVATVAGNEPARLRYLSVGGFNGSGGPLARVWLGIRDPYEGTANFKSHWEAELGTAGTGASVQADATASGASKMQVGFATATLALRMTITVGQVAAAAPATTNYQHFVGRYLVLCRLKVTAGATIGVQLRYGYSGSGPAVECEEQYVSNSAWRLIPLGEVTIPPAGYRPDANTPNAAQGTKLSVYAEHLAGTPASDKLDLDTFVLIPSEHLAYADGCAIQFNVIPDVLAWHCFEDDTEACLHTVAGSFSLTPEYATTDLYLPIGAPIIVIAAERSASHVLTDTLALSYQYHERWLSHREG